MADVFSSDRDLLRRFRGRVSAKLPGRVVKVVLYGSRARADADADADADLDVAVFLDGPSPGAEERRTISDSAYDIVLESGRFLHPIPLSIRRWDENSTFMKNVRRDAVEV